MLLVKSKFSETAARNVLWSKGENAIWYNLVWFQHSLTRHSFICWLAMQNGLPTILFVVLAIPQMKAGTTCSSIAVILSKFGKKVLNTSGITRTVGDWLMEVSCALRNPKGWTSHVLLLRHAWSAYIMFDELEMSVGTGKLWCAIQSDVKHRVIGVRNQSRRSINHCIIGRGVSRE